MEVRRFNSAQHLSTIKGWHSEWSKKGLQPYPWEILPDLGWVAYEGGYHPRAAIFLREAAGKVVYMDHVISDPSRRIMTGKYIDAIMEQVVDYCRTTGVKFLLSWSNRASMVARAKKYGADTYPATIIAWRVG